MLTLDRCAGLINPETAVSPLSSFYLGDLCAFLLDLLRGLLLAFTLDFCRNDRKFLSHLINFIHLFTFHIDCFIKSLNHILSQPHLDRELHFGVFVSIIQGLSPFHVNFMLTKNVLVAVCDFAYD